MAFRYPSAGHYTFAASASGDVAELLYTDPVATDATLPQTANTGRRWNWEDADTPSTDVGPTSGEGGSPEGYLYTEASSPAAAGDVFWIEKEDPASAGNPIAYDASTNDITVEFSTNQRGDENIAEIQVYTNEAGAGWVARGTDFGGGDVATAGTQIWRQRSVDLTGLISNASTRIAIRVTLVTTTSLFHQDVGLDRIAWIGIDSVSYEVDVKTFDEGGTALSGVTVDLWKDTGSNTLEFKKRTYSDGSGLATLADLTDNAATHFVVASKALELKASYVESGSATITSASGTTISVSLGQTVTKARTLCWYSLRGGNTSAITRPRRHKFRTQISSDGTKIEFIRLEAASAEDVILDWTVVELATGVLKSLQEVTLQSSTSSATVNSTITAVDPERTVLLVSESYDATTEADQDVAATYALTTPTNIQAVAAAVSGTTGQNTAHIFVAEFNGGVRVQRGIEDLGADAAGYNSTYAIRSIGDNPAIVGGLGLRGGSFSVGRNTSMVSLENSTSIRIQRTDIGTRIAGAQAWQVIEILDRERTVQQGTISFASGDASQNPTFTALGTSATMFDMFSGRPNSFNSDTTDVTREDQYHFSAALGADEDDVLAQRVNALRAFSLFYNVFDWRAGTTVEPARADVSERTITPQEAYSGTVDLYLRSQVDKSETAGDGDLRLRSQASKVSTGISGNGDLAASAASLAGQGTSQSAGQGALTAQSSLAGSGTSRSVGLGALAANDNTLAGQGAAVSPGSGNLQATASSLQASGGLAASGNGTLPSGDSGLAGSADLRSLGDGGLAAQDSALAGSGLLASSLNGGGVLPAAAASLIGEGTVAAAGNGDLAASAAVLVGQGLSRSLGQGALATAASLNGEGVIVSADIAGAGSLASGAAQMAAGGISQSLGQGSPSAEDSALAGGGTSVSSGNGNLQDNSSVSGQGSVIWLANGALAANAANVAGSGVSGSAGNGSLDVSLASLAGSADTGETLVTGQRNYAYRRRQSLKSNTRAA